MSNDQIVTPPITRLYRHSFVGGSAMLEVDFDPGFDVQELVYLREWLALVDKQLARLQIPGSNLTVEQIPDAKS